MLVKPTLIKKMERMNVVIVSPQQQWANFVPRYNLYAINMNCGRNCYNCREFGHIVRHCRSRRMIGQG